MDRKSISQMINNFFGQIKTMNNILVFELLNGVFKQNSNKTIALIKNNECDDSTLFPIMFYCQVSNIMYI
ncbi:unnamed protein product [Paramecium octaurelia]|uniref:Uncharacterized protein n=1 Tax=Paramecium octaurelia TaxID=43137 RepID=A0A8S1YRD7_PAROT|nr:unnamed protein product [Paramecium octaurelia]